jgi:uncharacterized membrane protein YeaQ/YmgE (transglycosylase-associated protein family)
VEIFLLLIAMTLVGLIIGWLAGIIWKGSRPIGTTGDYIASIAAAIIIGLIDWFVIPAMGFSDQIKYLGLALEPALGALLVLWIIRQAKK